MLDFAHPSIELLTIFRTSVRLSRWQFQWLEIVPRRKQRLTSLRMRLKSGLRQLTFSTLETRSRSFILSRPPSKPMRWFCTEQTAEPGFEIEKTGYYRATIQAVVGLFINEINVMVKLFTPSELCDEHRRARTRYLLVIVCFSCFVFPTVYLIFCIGDASSGLRRYDR